MKKLLLTLLLPFLTEAQLSENFNDTSTFPPAGWTILDNGVGSMSWTFANSEQFHVNDTPCAFINRQNIYAGNTSEDWLVTPFVSVSSGEALIFTSKQTVFADNLTTFRIMASTTSQTDMSSFFPIATWTENELNPVYNAPTEIAVSLEQFAGQQVYLAFARTYTQPGETINGERWLIDDVYTGHAFLINGTVGFDASGNCENGQAVSNIKINAVGPNFTRTAFTNANGEYSFYFPDASAVLTPDFAGASNFAISPANYSFTYVEGNANQADFCLSPNGVQKDLEIQLLPLDPARPGFDANYKLIYSNKSAIASSGTIVLNFDGTPTDFVTSNPATQSQTENFLTWSYDNLLPFEHREITFTLNLNSPMETPALNSDDQLNFEAIINPVADDAVIGDNYSRLKQTVVNSMDPNDKQVMEGETITPDETSNYLHYLIRFQNTGTFYAEKVVVRDALDENLDWSTLEIIGASHEVRTALQENQLEFTFDDIDLPAEVDNEPESHGYVAFKIRPVAGFALNESVSNTANIYFDFNFPIVTNTVTTTVSLLSTPEFGRNNEVRLFPNPAKESVAIQSENAIESVKIISITGQLLVDKRDVFGTQTTISTDGLRTGTYFVKVLSDQSESTLKLIVQ